MAAAIETIMHLTGTGDSAGRSPLTQNLRQMKMGMSSLAASWSPTSPLRPAAAIRGWQPLSWQGPSPWLSPNNSTHAVVQGTKIIIFF